MRALLPLWLCGVLLVSQQFDGLLCAGYSTPNTSPWLLRASTLQRFLTYDMPLDQVPMIATHNSFNSEEQGVSSPWEVVPNQVFSITQQLACLGVRGLELDLHFVEELMTEGVSQEEATLVCHARSSTARKIREACEQTRWYLCEAIGLLDFGDDTGCASTAPTLKDTFAEISAWLALPENSQQLLFIKMETFVGSNEDLVPNYISEVFGADVVFGPLDLVAWERTSGTEGWPTTENLLSNRKRLVFASSSLQNNNNVFNISKDNDDDTHFYEENTSVWRFMSVAPCSSRTRAPSWSRVQGDASVWKVEISGATLFEVAPEPSNFLSEADVSDVLECELIPTFDRMDTNLMEATIWSWAEGEPHAYFSSPRAAVVDQETGRWTSGSATDNRDYGGEIHSFACRKDASGERGEWVVLSGAAGYFAAGEPVCTIQGLVFGCPRTAKENASLREAMIEANVRSAWINLRSPGGKRSSTWTRESGVPYTLPATYTHATCDGGTYYAAATYTWNAEDAWVNGDLAFFEKAERIRGEAQHLREKAEALLSTQQQEDFVDTDNSAATEKIRALSADALLKQAEWIENAAREAGAYPKGW